MAAEGDKVFRRRDGLFHSRFRVAEPPGGGGGGGATAFRPMYDLFDSSCC